MNLNLTPVEVNIDIESLSLERDAFYNVCFIAENNTAKRTVVVNTLKELIDAGYARDSLAYNFCVGVFAQQSMPLVYIRAKRDGETYRQAYDAEDNSSYYFVVIQSKDDLDISDFNDYISDLKDPKLQFYSSDNPPLLNRKLVHYSQTTIDPVKDVDGIYINIENFFINKAYKLGYYTKDIEKISTDDFRKTSKLRYSDKTYRLLYTSRIFDAISSSYFQKSRLAYPEAAWIAYCGNMFPSTVQWLYKNLSKVDISKSKSIPDLSNITAIVMDNKVTTGSGKTTQGYPIQEQVSLDWVVWALGRKVWSTLYKTNGILTGSKGADIITNEVKYVLDLTKDEYIFTDYKIKEVVFNKSSNNISIRFNASLSNTIVSVEIGGSLYH